MYDFEPACFEDILKMERKRKSGLNVGGFQTMEVKVMDDFVMIVLIYA